MNKFSLLVFFVLISSVFGCEQKQPVNDIFSEIYGNDNFSGIRIIYYSENSMAATQVDLKNEEELSSYKKKVEFLLKEIEETQRRMNVNSEITEE